MSPEKYNDDEINRLLNQAFLSSKDEMTPLRTVFNKRLESLGISFNQARENLEVSYRALNAILDGSSDQVDFVSLLKIAQFLGISYSDVTSLYAEAISDKNRQTLDVSERRTFILNNFDLPVLKSIGLIDSIRDLDHVELKLKEMLGLEKITDYNSDEFETVFSSSSKVPKNLRTRRLFIRKARKICKLIGNPFSYNKQELIDYVPRIRWNSIDTEKGLIKVMQALYSLGVTVIFQPKMPSLQVRGATFILNNKPCIVLTDFKGHYPTFWFALLHEIYHVIFDWKEITAMKYHLSDEEEDDDAVRQKEHEADSFARDYMASPQTMEIAAGKINERLFIRELALEKHVHPSIIYANYAYEHSGEETNFWHEFRKQKLLPPITELISNLSGGLFNTSQYSAFVDYYKSKIYN